eukprot:c16053_g1_i1.p1 GENE.c16053_g1_i1~~c16053_g1_i1.p1  ORF type:complete len:375 (-),score=144.79 c16053_g1_i1:26-1123(-)
MRLIVILIVFELFTCIISRRVVPKYVDSDPKMFLERDINDIALKKIPFDPVMTHVVKSGKEYHGIGKNSCSGGILYEADQELNIREGQVRFSFKPIDSNDSSQKLAAKLTINEEYDRRGSGSVNSRLGVIISAGPRGYSAVLSQDPFQFIPEWSIRDGPMRLYACIQANKNQIEKVFPGWKVEASVPKTKSGVTSMLQNKKSESKGFMADVIESVTAFGKSVFGDDNSSKEKSEDKEEKENSEGEKKDKKEEKDKEEKDKEDSQKSKEDAESEKRSKHCESHPDDASCVMHNLVQKGKIEEAEKEKSFWEDSIKSVENLVFGEDSQTKTATQKKSNHKQSKNAKKMAIKHHLKHSKSAKKKQIFE